MYNKPMQAPIVSAPGQEEEVVYQYRTPAYIRLNNRRYYARNRDEIMEIQRLFNKRLAADEEFQLKKKRMMAQARADVRARRASIISSEQDQK
jgi:hypothetical protein